MHAKHSSPARAGIAFALLLLTGASARADLIVWAYNWEPGTTKVAADGSGTGYVALTDEPSKAASGSSNTIVTNLRAFSTATEAKPDTFIHAPVTFTLHLVDTASNQTGSVTFSGFLSGTLTANSANIKSTFTSPTTERVNLGGNQYTVTLGTYTPPGPPGVSNAGSLNAFVTVVPGGNGHISSAPEPSALLLASLALPGIGLSGWLRRHKRMGTPLSAV
jgi:hypothetical protein